MIEPFNEHITSETLAAVAEYGSAKLEKSLKPLEYDNNPTQLQRQIELSVTNGRGYLSLDQSLNFANQNKNVTPVSVPIALSKGIAPLYFEEDISEYSFWPKHPCAESVVQEFTELNLINLCPVRTPTILERVEKIQEIDFLKKVFSYGRRNVQITTVKPSEEFPYFENLETVPALYKEFLSPSALKREYAQK